jgi:hypothetical protein
MNTTPETIGRIAYATGGTIIAAAILLALFFAAGEPFGTLNDVFNAMGGILCGILAWMLFSRYHAQSRLISQIAAVFASIGALGVAFGTILVIFKITGWVLAGWYTSTGFALIGIWLTVFCALMLGSDALPHRFALFGMIVGLVMAVGLVAIGGILNKVDSMQALPMYLNISYLGYLGDILFVIWSMLLARALVAR